MVYRHLEAFSIDALEYRPDDQGFRSSERMVADEQILLGRIQVFLASDLVRYSYIFQCVLAESCTVDVFCSQNTFVELILMDASLEEVDDEAWKLLYQLRSEDLVYIEQIIFSSI